MPERSAAGDQKRAVHFGRRLGREDHVVTWLKRQRLDWMGRETYLRRPDALASCKSGCACCAGSARVQGLATHLTAPSGRAEDLAELYRARWQAELDLLSVKVALGRDVLRCKTSDLVRKELGVHLMAYNLIRGDGSGGVSIGSRATRVERGGSWQRRRSRRRWTRRAVTR